MNAIAKTVLATIIAAAILANAACLYEFSARLTRIETKLEILLPYPVEKTAHR
ncbi:MAG: hypothetical protein WDM76_09495 [Limisphaerales bacterium]